MAGYRVGVLDGNRILLSSWYAARGVGVGVRGVIGFLHAVESVLGWGVGHVGVIFREMGKGEAGSRCPVGYMEELNHCRELCRQMGVVILDGVDAEDMAGLAGTVVAGGNECLVVTDHDIGLEDGVGVKVLTLDGAEVTGEGHLRPAGSWELDELRYEYPGDSVIADLLSGLAPFSRIPFGPMPHFLSSLLGEKVESEGEVSASYLGSPPTTPADLLDELRAGRFALHAKSVGDGVEVALATGAGTVVTRIFRQGEVSYLADVLGDAHCFGYVHDLKAVGALLGGVGLPDHALRFDVKLAAYMLEPDTKEYSIEGLSRTWLGVELGSSDPAVVVRLIRVMGERLRAQVEERGMGEVLEGVEVPVARILMDMEGVGFLVDRKRFAAVREPCQLREEELRREIQAIAGWKINLNKDTDVSKLLFNKLELPPGRMTASGFYSTSKDVLESLVEEHEIIPPLLEWRALSSLLKDMATYEPEIDQTGRLHPTMNQTAVVTGRLSTTSPNLQGVRGKTELDRKLRSAFMPSPGHLLISADYSQIELRVLGHLSGDVRLIEAFRSGEDIHTNTANELLKLSGPNAREVAKAVNFAIVYGSGPARLAKECDIPENDAKNYRARWQRRYCRVREYKEQLLRQARETGEVDTILRRKIPVRTLDRKGQRKVLNHVIQGSAADLMKLAMVQLQHRLREGGWDACMILQIHDELILEARESQAAEVARIVEETMVGALTLRTGLKVKVRVGETWAELGK